MQKISLSELFAFNTFRIQPHSGDIYLTNNEKELAEFLLSMPHQDRMNVSIAGELSNTVLGEHLPGPLVLFRDGTSCNIEHRSHKAFVTISGSYTFDSLIQVLCQENISGIEFLSGIPGTVGGAISQNVAAYGQQISKYLQYVRVFDLANNSIIQLSHSALNFSYRSSVLKQSQSYSPRFIILEAVFAFPLTQSPEPITYNELSEQHKLQERSTHNLLDRRATVLEVRERKGMVVDGAHWIPCAGSFFMSPIVDSETAARIARAVRGNDFAGSFFSWYKPDDNHTRLPAALIMRAAGFLNGDQWGTVGLSPHHILALCSFASTSKGSAIYALSRYIQAQVLQEYNIYLEPEVRFLGTMEKIPIDAFLRTNHFKAGIGEPTWAQRLGVPDKAQ